MINKTEKSFIKTTMAFRFKYFKIRERQKYNNRPMRLAIAAKNLLNSMLFFKCKMFEKFGFAQEQFKC